MKIMVIIILIITYLGAKDIQNGVEIHYYKNGQIKSKVTYKNGKKEGVALQYEKDGFLRYEEWYKNDLLQKSNTYRTYKEGYIREFGEAGSCFFSDDSPICKQMESYDDYLSDMVVYDREKGVYTDTIYYKSGQIHYETTNKISGDDMDYTDMERKVYYITGILKKINNNKVDITYYPNGQIAIDKNGTYPSSIEEFTKVYRGSHFHMREPIEKEARKNLVGTHYKNIENNYDLQYYNSDGDIRYIVPYRNNKKEGLAVKLYYKRGYYLKTTMYKNDKKDGYETVYKKEGKLGERKIETLLNWSSAIYDNNDMLVSKVLYKKGKKL